MTLILQDGHLKAEAWAACAQGGIDFFYSYDRNEWSRSITVRRN